MAWIILLSLPLYLLIKKFSPMYGLYLKTYHLLRQMGHDEPSRPAISRLNRRYLDGLSVLVALIIINITAIMFVFLFSGNIL